MKNLNKDARIDWIGRQPGDAHPILYFSGILGKKHAERIIHERTAYKYRCISFAYWKIEERVKWATDYLATNKVRMFFDSGAFSLQKDKDCTVEKAEAFTDEYAACLRRPDVQWDWYAPVDWRRDSTTAAAALTSMHRRKLYPAPVYHGNDPLYEFEKILDDGYKLVAIAQPQPQGGGKKAMMAGDALRRHYQTLFNTAAKYKDVAIHGFSQTGKLMFEFPFYSTDSTSWSSGSSRGQIFIVDVARRKLTAVYLGTTSGKERLDWRAMPKHIREPFEFQIKRWGFTEQELVTDYMARIAFNILALQEATLDTRSAHRGAYHWQRIIE